MKNIDDEVLSLDQLRIFIAAADHGSFSAAARTLGKTQSLVSYSIQRMEEQLRVTLFDRTSYRPSITKAGDALLARARRIHNEVNIFQELSRELAAGAETEIRIAVDAMFPMCDLYRLLSSFKTDWPAVSPRVVTHNAGDAANEVLERRATIGLLAGASGEHAELDVASIKSLALIPVVSSRHPLSKTEKHSSPNDLNDHVKIVLFDPETEAKPGSFVYSPNTWNISDVGAAYGMIRAGLGWGAMPHHLVEEDLLSGRLVELNSHTREDQRPLKIQIAKRKDTVLQPASSWVWHRLTELHEPVANGAA
ncbi:LysR family transcriptional regulator [Stenotrophomonas maltophilia]|uniref:LysR family transcriptional regulator n=1 Tax=Stenotrophomonas maltophilia TaxID=40324 RepID=UPI0025549911|nr:LysR family transcriptional regulator [Stenotrophomonas maltophilia]